MTPHDPGSDGSLSVMGYVGPSVIVLVEINNGTEDWKSWFQGNPRFPLPP